MARKDYDFSGYATKCNIECSDGRIIMPSAFADSDGKSVPLVWQHNHQDPEYVIGHADLENRNGDIYSYCYLNNLPKAQFTKELLAHGDIAALSIYANQLTQKNGAVIHGNIREVSVVLAGANPGAYIDEIIAHDGLSHEDEALITIQGEDILLAHSSDGDESDEDDLIGDNISIDEKEDSSMAHADDEKPLEDKSSDEKTIKDVISTMSEEQKDVMYGLIGEALKSGKSGADEDDDEEGNDMKHNVFENDEQNRADVLMHDAFVEIMDDLPGAGTFKRSAKSYLAHGDYGIDDIGYLFPEPKTLNTPPEFIKRDTGWVSGVMNGVHHTPFSRIKSMFADITEDEARAKGYIKGNLKRDEVFTLLKRVTQPTTIYKKQKFDRDDLTDITDFDVLSWVRAEMRMMLDEELARAILIGDGRSGSSDDKINEQNIRPIWTDEDLFTVKVPVNVKSSDSDDTKAKNFIRTAIKARKQYKGSGNPSLYTTNDVVVDCLLIEDTTGRRIYNTVNDLATALRVKEIIEVEVMEGQTRDVSGTTHTLLGLMVNLSDYNVGADKGGAVTMFDDFDIDYNQQKYLIETRCSGALIKPYSALAFEQVTTA